MPSAREVINELRSWANLLFLSNNSGQLPSRIVRHLRNLAFEIYPNEVINSVILVAECISSFHSNAHIFVLGSHDLQQELRQRGHILASPEEAEFLIVGVDKEITYAKFAQALSSLLKGAKFIATNIDPVYPSSDGIYPAAGAFVGFFEGMGFIPDLICGKPDKNAIEKALELRGMTRGSNCLFIGDHLQTDILGAQNIGVDSVLVLTGISTESDIEQYSIYPTYVIRNLSQLKEIIFGDTARFILK